MKNDPNPEYIKEGEPDKKTKKYAWDTAIGLQDVDGLKTSSYLSELASKNINGEITYDEVTNLLRSYYQAKPNTEENKVDESTDLVATRISELLSRNSFHFSIASYCNIHHYLFDGILDTAGKFRQYNMIKKEWVLDGDTVIYTDYLDIEPTLEYEFYRESSFSYSGLSKDAAIKHLAQFISSIWQIHPFTEGNTRTVAVFMIKYLRSIGFFAENDLIADNAWYFRNCLVRANYQNYELNIVPDASFLEKFLRNLLLDEKNPMDNKKLHIAGLIKS